MTCLHTEIRAADQNCSFIQPWHTDNTPFRPNADTKSPAYQFPVPCHVFFFFFFFFKSLPLWNKQTWCGELVSLLVFYTPSAGTVTSRPHGEGHWATMNNTMFIVSSCPWSPSASLLMFCTTPHHTDCSPEPQDPCTNDYVRYSCRKWEFLFYTMSASEDRYLRIKHQLITAQL